MESIFFKINLFLAIYLTGVIWMVQLVHYPLMSKVGTQSFQDYQKAHTRSMTPVVAGQMILELITGLGLLWYFADDILFWINAALVVLIWLSTFLVQVPLHERLLQKGWEKKTHLRLVQTNWWRTIAWTARAFIMMLLN